MLWPEIYFLKRETKVQTCPLYAPIPLLPTPPNGRSSTVICIRQSLTPTLPLQLDFEYGYPRVIKRMKPSIMRHEILYLDVSWTNFWCKDGVSVKTYSDKGFSLSLIKSTASCGFFTQTTGRIGPKISSFMTGSSGLTSTSSVGSM